ncbi:MAG: hypothetical protein VXZ28_02040 [Bacteroidota bacterium]|nr:hypothetical protein [Bacteroidota bacterium]MEC7950069.1 hypothetical protein [Bacteroidota bacterium]MEC8361799.1 hypothetical protein [Bacteroidota bacterium]MEC8400091.1 hypothetical protein [Bacteroidota bacterium]
MKSILLFFSRFCAVLLTLGVMPPASAQSPEWARVVAAQENLTQASTEEDRLALHGQLQGLWAEALSTGHAFDVAWGEWNNAVVDLGKDEARMIVFTWNVELDDRTQRYGGWVATASPQSALGYTFTMLNHDRDADPADAGRMHRHDRWHGGLYYSGILTYDRNTPVYTLLAWDGADALTTRKWVETVETRHGRVRFGAPRFDTPNGLVKRVVLTYADAVQATLRVEEGLERIVFDHLAPEDPSFRGQYAFYGPTLNYDGLTWRKGRWYYSSDVAVKNGEDSSPREYRDPSRRRRRS